MAGNWDEQLKLLSISDGGICGYLVIQYSR